MAWADLKAANLKKKWFRNDGVEVRHYQTQAAQESIDMGQKAENIFSQWLDLKSYAYLPVSQLSSEYYSKALKDMGAQRPDFILLVENIGTIIVDVKARKRYSEMGRFYMSVEERERLKNFKTNFNTNVWLCFLPIEKGEEGESGINDEAFYFCTIDKFYTEFAIEEKRAFTSVCLPDEHLIRIQADESGSISSLVV